MKPCIVILDDWEQNFQTHAASQTDWQVVAQQAHVTIYHETLPAAKLLEALQAADVVVLMRDRTPFRADLIEQLPKLKYVVFTGTRNTQLDFAALAARGIPVSGTAFGPSKENTCEITWGLILGAVKQLEANFNLMRTTSAGHGWRSAQRTTPMGLLHGQRLGLVGLGEIGARVAAVGKAFGMEVVCWSPNMTPERARAKDVLSVALDELLATSKVVSLHLVPSAQTKHLIDASKLALMRADAVLVNTSRASLIDMNALQIALEQALSRVMKQQGAAARHETGSGCGFAALDVYEQEPLAADHWLRRAPNVVLTPHVGFVCAPVCENFDVGVAQCLAAWVQGRPLMGLTHNP